MFKYLKNNEINNFKNHKRSYRKYWFKFMDFKIKDNIWWDCTFKGIPPAKINTGRIKEQGINIWSEIGCWADILILLTFTAGYTQNL
jgi:hypothetical protein